MMQKPLAGGHEALNQSWINVDSTLYQYYVFREL